MAATPESFNIDISRFVKKAKGRGRLLAIEFIQDLNEAVLGAPDFPVITGFLRGSAFSALNAVPAGTPTADAGGGSTIARVNLTLVGLKLGDVFRLAFTADYAMHVEFGTATMTARAFVRRPLARASEIADAAARRIAAMP